jgi:hypothetical protein
LALSGAFGGSTVSVFEVPSIFALEPSIHYILTRHELVPLVEVAKGMPSLAGDVASIEAQLPHVEAALAFNYFKRPGLAVRRDDPPLFFGEDFHVDWEHSRELSRDIYLGVGSDERCRAYSLRERIRSLAASADAFEQYLLSREVYHRTKRWAAVLSSFQRCIYSPLIQGADPAHGRTSVEMVARLAFTKSERLQRELVIAWLEPQIEDRLRSDPSLWRNLDALKAQWLSNLRFSEARGNPTDMLSTAVLSSAFVNCVDRLGRFDQETLSGRFALVIETTAILSTLSELEKQKYAHTLMTLAVRLSASCEFARFYYIVSTYVLVDLDIQATCTEKDLTAWFVFETAILSLIHDHPSLATLFYTISNSSTSRTLA